MEDIILLLSGTGIGGVLVSIIKLIYIDKRASKSIEFESLNEAIALLKEKIKQLELKIDKQDAEIDRWQTKYYELFGEYKLLKHKFDYIYQED